MHGRDRDSRKGVSRRFLLAAAPLVSVAAACAAEEGGRGRADGSITAWREVAPMPHPRANHCSAAVGGFLVVVGGNYREGDEWITSDEVHAAPIEADGTLGAWRLAGRTPSAVTECNAAADGRTLYLVDGLFEDAADEGKVWSATLSGGGELSTFAVAGDLGDRRAISSEAWIEDGTLYLMDTVIVEGDESSVTLLGEIDGDGIADWQSDDWSIGFRGQAQFAFEGNRLYVIGGYLGASEGNEVVGSVSVAAVDSDRSVGADRSTTALPAPRTFGEAIGVDGYVFVVGGREAIFGATGEATVFVAAAGADGGLGAWAETEPLPEGRTNHDLVLAGDHLYVTGGSLEGPGLDSVFAARVRK